MFLTSLRLRNWRNIAAADLPLSPDLTLFVGPNAQGKTNVLEAVHYLATASSHRTHRHQELVRWDQPVAHIRGEVVSGVTSHVLECGLEHGTRVVKRDGRALPRIGDLYGILRVALFATEDLEIISGAPQERRRFLDMAVAQFRPGYVRLLQQYRRALRQRNQVLRAMSTGSGSTCGVQLEAWDASVAELAGEVSATRQESVRKLAPVFQTECAGLALDGPADLVHKTRCEGESATEIAQSILSLLQTHRRADVERCTTTCGPHRDDLSITLAGRPLAVFGSQGQQRAAALALRLAESRLLAQESGETPVLLVDDVIYELDRDRRQRFWERIPGDYQLLATATDHRELAAKGACGGMFHVTCGSLHSAGP